MASNVLKQKKSGFALLMTLVVVMVLISIGLAVVELTLKQVRLSTNAKESEAAFHAANAGVECARYIRRIASTTMETGGAITPSCFSATPYTNTKINLLSSANGNVYMYIYGFTWGAKPRCSMMSTIVMAASPTGSGLSFNVGQYIPGYPSATPKTCNPGERCTVLSSHGYNRTCDSIDGYGSIEREVLLQF